MNKEQMVAAFNEWIRQSTDDPEKFESNMTTAKRFLDETKSGETPSYGQICAAFMLQLNEELSGQTA